MRDGILAIIMMERYLEDLAKMPETRLNISIKECLQFVIDNRPDTERSLNDSAHLDQMEEHIRQVGDVPF